MANKVYSTEEIELQDWPNPVKIYPLVIKKIREVWKIIEKCDADNETTILDMQIKIAAFCMKTFEPELASEAKIVAHVDLATLNRICEVAAGIKVQDPNLTAAVAASGMKD